jgi:hypothetical protein
MNDTRTSPLAVISLVAGILGWTLLPLLGSLGAIITGHMARSEIRRSAGTVDGNGLAIAGLVLGWGLVVFTLVGVLIAIVFFGGLAALLAWLGLSGQLG